MEVKQQEDEEDEEDEDGEGGGCSKGGKLSNIKAEDKPIKSELKNEECSGDGGKGNAMDTSSSTTSLSVVKTEDRKPEIKKEPKEEEEGSESGAQSGAHIKKKSMFNFLSPDRKSVV